MTPHPATTAATRPLLNELRWLVRLRWLAAVAVIVLVTATGLLAGWQRTHWLALALGATVLTYNVPLWLILKSPQRQQSAERSLVKLAWLQILLDLIILTVITQWTGGATSPVRGFFILHMVLASLLLSPFNSYMAAMISVVLVVGGLWITDQMPQNSQGYMVLGGWTVVLLLTVFLTSHITADWRRQHVEVQDQHERQRAILATAADGIITINSRGIIESANAAANRIFGYQSGEMIGRPINQFMPEPYRSQHDSYIANFIQTRKPKIIGFGREVVGLRKDGSTFPLDLAVSEVLLHGREMFTGIVRDITERKAAEQELVSLNESLQRHQQAMIQQEKLAAMGQMAAGIVHEISNPLACMDSLLQLVKRHPDRLDPGTLESMQQQVARIHRITRELTDFAHPNETAWELRPLNELVQRALEMVRFDHRIRRVEVVRQFDEAAGDVRVMAPAFQQVIVNLVINALDAMKESASPRLVISTSVNGCWKVVQVTDNGPGISREHLPRLFEPFFTTKPLGQGTGLGLSICSSLMQRHGGRCEVTSEVGCGATFRVLLPRVADAETSREHSAQDRANS